MIIWINGAFGSGKTALANVLLERLHRSRLFDPERVGAALRILRLSGNTGDYQDSPIWRYAVGRMSVLLHRNRAAPLIVPMTIVNAGYLAEILGPALLRNLQILHIFLDADPATLEHRIRSQVVVEGNAVRDQKVRQWRLAQINRCVAARDRLPADTLIFDSVKNSPDRLAEKVVEIVGNADASAA